MMINTTSGINTDLCPTYRSWPSAEAKVGHSVPDGNGGRSIVEAEAAQLLGIALPVLGDLDPQVQEDLGAEQRLDLLASAGSDVLQPFALVPDQDPLLAGPFD